MADHDIKNAVRGIECPVFENPAFTTLPPLKDAEVRRDIWFFLLPMDSMQS